MKRFSILLLATMALGLTTYADEYLPLLREGVKWVYSEELNYLGPDDELTFERLYTIEVKGDTVIDNVIYKKIYRTSNVVPWYGDEHYAEPFCSNSQPVACLREEGTKVYAKVLKDYYDDGLTPFLEDLLYNLNTGEEVVLYEFDEDEGSPCTLIGTTTVGNATCKVYSCEGVFGNVVEGVGLDTKYCGDLLMYSRSTIISNPYSYIGLHHMEDADGNIIYKGAAYTEKDYVPLLREGVKWVYSEEFHDLYNINEGDTNLGSSRKYAIELRGDTVIAGTQYKKCYRICNDDVSWTELSFSNTQPVACLREEGKKVYGRMLMANELELETNYWENVDSEKDCIWWNDELNCSDEGLIYDFDSPKDFTLTSTIEISGRQCNVFTYNESDDYKIIESVGFDNDKEGDLLCPFLPYKTGLFYTTTGLHHMEDADGNIILKLKTVADYPGNGDMNGDGIIDVEDVNALVNIILKL